MNIERITDTSKPNMGVRKHFFEKVKYICSLLPNNEWSGILFYRVDKSPLNKDFPDITCEDLLLMDVGGATTTEFSINSEVAAYMAENPELIDCQTGLIHSHAGMNVFYSTTDLSTLGENAGEVNHFVSLVVNNKDNYLGAITRKVNGVVDEDHKINYHSFNNEVGTYTKKDTREYTDMQYCIFDVSFNDEEAPLSEACKNYLSDRVESLKKEHKYTHKSGFTIWEDPDASFTDGEFVTPKYQRYIKEEVNVDLACLQLISLSPLVDRFDTTFMASQVTHILTKLNNRFGNLLESEYYTQYLYNFIDTWFDEISLTPYFEDFVGKVIDRLEELGDEPHIKFIAESLRDYLEEYIILK